MSSQHIHALTPGMTAPVPRLGTLRAVLLHRLARFGRTVWLALEDHGRHRAARELLALADRWQHEQPKLARELRSYARGGSSY